MERERGKEGKEPLISAYSQQKSPKAARGPRGRSYVLTVSAVTYASRGVLIQLRLSALERHLEP